MIKNDRLENIPSDESFLNLRKVCTGGETHYQDKRASLFLWKKFHTNDPEILYTFEQSEILSELLKLNILLSSINCCF